MRTEAPPPRPRYRNEAVFRSAERLLASPPKQPARRLPSRSIVFLLGLACGLGVAFWLIRPVRQSEAPTASADSASGSTHVDRKRPTLPLANAQPTIVANAPVAAPTPTPAADSPPAPTATPPATPGAPRATATALAPRSAVRPPPAAEFASLGAFLTQPTNLIKLRGELRDGPAGKRTVDFELTLTRGRHDGGSARGLVWLADERVRAEPFRVTGEWFDRTIFLRETVKMIHGSSPPPAHSFVLKFPHYGESDPISGTWSHGWFTGKLVLQVVPPL